MLKKILQHNISQKFFGLLIAYYLKICFHTSSWNIKNEKTILSLIKKKEKIIVCFWHSKLLMTVFCWKYSKRLHSLIQIAEHLERLTATL